MIDTHCHLDDKKITDIKNAISDLELVITSSSSVFDLPVIKTIAADNKSVYFTAGIHPHNATAELDKIEQLNDYITDKKCVAIGEIGLDFFYNFSEQDKQIKIFEKQIRIAADYQLPMIVHTRNAEKTVFEILENIDNLNILLHCFTGDINILSKFLRKPNVFVSIGGMITFKNNANIVEILKITPKNRLLLETDSPYLAPAPFRGKINIPNNIRFVYLKISELLEIEFNELERIIYNNLCIFLNKNILGVRRL